MGIITDLGNSWASWKNRLYNCSIPSTSGSIIVSAGQDIVVTTHSGEHSQALAGVLGLPEEEQERERLISQRTGRVIV